MIRKSRFASEGNKPSLAGSQKPRFPLRFESNQSKAEESRYLGSGSTGKINKHMFIDLKRIENVQDDDNKIKFQIVEQSRRMAARKKEITTKHMTASKKQEIWNTRSLVSRIKLR